LSRRQLTLTSGSGTDVVTTLSQVGANSES
jgi:hypothetical protein